jgi:hypothetical protein
MIESCYRKGPLMHTFDKSLYPRGLAGLIDDHTECALDAGTQNHDVATTLESLELRDAFAPQVIRDLLMAQACQSGLLLLHNFLDRSHTASQQIDTPTGSFWHGIMHRREGDYSNAKYWFRRVGEHPVFESLALAAHGVCDSLFPDEKNWDPYTYIDCCEAAVRSATPDVPVLGRVARIEWELLFDFSYRRAVEP